MLATQLHNALCPKCNNRCHFGGPCRFNHEANKTDWDTNSANHFFLELSEKATDIMAELNISEEQFIAYAQAVPYGTDIPAEVYQAMKTHGFIN